MKGQHELPVDNFKRFAQEHGERKKQSKLNWNDYIRKLQRGMK